MPKSLIELALAKDIETLKAEVHEQIREGVDNGLIDKKVLYIKRFDGDDFEPEHNYWLLIVPELRRKICVEWDACNKLESLKKYDGDQKALATVITELIADILVGVPVATIAVLITKIGIEKFCHCAD